jgi:hypothetical protein
MIENERQILKIENWVDIGNDWLAQPGFVLSGDLKPVLPLADF